MELETINHLIQSLILPLALITHLIVAAARDLATKEIPNSLTLVPLLLAIGWRTLGGDWEYSIAFAFITLFSERIVTRSKAVALSMAVAGFIGAGYFLGSSSYYWTILGWLGAWLLWEANAIGGADVKLMMLLLTIYPNARMFFILLLAKLVAGLVIVAALYGRHLGKRLTAAALRSFLTLRLPSRDELEKEGQPAAFIYTLTGVAYVLAVQGLSQTDLAAWRSLIALGLAFGLATIPIVPYLIQATRRTSETLQTSAQLDENIHSTITKDEIETA